MNIVVFLYALITFLISTFIFSCDTEPVYIRPAAVVGADSGRVQNVPTLALSICLHGLGRFLPSGRNFAVEAVTEVAAYHRSSVLFHFTAVGAELHSQVEGRVFTATLSFVFRCRLCLLSGRRFAKVRFLFRILQYESGIIHAHDYQSGTPAFVLRVGAEGQLSWLR